MPVKRSHHAACCINVGDDHPLLLVTGGWDEGYGVLKDAWLLDIVARRWKEVSGFDNTLSTSSSSIFISTQPHIHVHTLTWLYVCV